MSLIYQKLSIYMFCKFIEDDLAAWKTICSKVCVSDQPLFQRYSVVLCFLGWPLGCRYDVTAVVVGPRGWCCFWTKTGGKIFEPRVVLQKATCSSRSWRQSSDRSTPCQWWARHLDVFFPSCRGSENCVLVFFLWLGRILCWELGFMELLILFFWTKRE